MRAKLRAATASVTLGACLFGACQAVTGLGDLQKVECVLDCDAGIRIPADAETGPPCSHTFCASFDEAAVITGWRAMAQSPGTMLALDTVVFRSPPASLLVSIPPSNSTSIATMLSQTFTQGLKGAHLELDLRVGQSGAFPEVDAGPITDAGSEAGTDAGSDAGGDGGDGGDAGKDAGQDAGTGPAVDTGGMIRLASITALDAETATGVTLAWRKDGPVVLVATPSGVGVSELALRLEPAPARDTWVRVKLDVVFDAAGSGSVKVSIDGVSVLDRSGLSIVGSGMPAAQLELGLVTRNATPEFKSNYDNLTLDLDP